MAKRTGDTAFSMARVIGINKRASRFESAVALLPAHSKRFANLAAALPLCVHRASAVSLSIKLVAARGTVFIRG